MRVKLRFNPEACQSPIIIDLRFLPRIGERLQIGFRRVIEVLEVRRVENDSRYAGIIRGKYIFVERTASPAPPPRPMPMPPIQIPVPVIPAPASANYGNLSFDDLDAVVGAEPTVPEPNL
jgi:hypothetical protein